MTKKTKRSARFDVVAKLQPVNDPAQRGQLATPKAFFGDFHRFAVAAVHTRFDAVQWFVWDADADEGCGPDIVRQAATFAEAVAGLGGK